MRNTVKSALRRFEEIKWLEDVRDVRYPLDGSHPLFVREFNVARGPAVPRPTVPFPERHSFCEFNVLLEGSITQFVGNEKMERRKGDMMLLGPGVPHYALCHSYPHHTITIYFLPLALFEMGPKNDGAWFLSRFTARQEIGQRVIHPSPALISRLMERARHISREFSQAQPGSELKMLAMFVDALVDLLRWEASTGRWHPGKMGPHHWIHLQKALRFLHEHFAEAIYIDDVAEASGLTANRLRSLFREALGMSCSQYLHTLRIAEAKSLLCLPNAQVTDAALAVGFETLSHFNASFRKLTGLSPTEYLRTISRKA